MQRQRIGSFFLAVSWAMLGSVLTAGGPKGKSPLFNGIHIGESSL